MIKKTLGLLSLALSIVLFSCSSDDSNSNSNNNPKNNPTASSISATIDGQSWSFTGYGVTAIEDIYEVGEMNSHGLQISGFKSGQSSVTVQQSTIYIDIPGENLAEGTYSSSSEDFYGTLTYTNYDRETYFSTRPGASFTITISNIDLTTGTISGTFSGTLVDMNGNSVTITNGEFYFGTIWIYRTFANVTISLSKNGGDIFTMDSSQEDGKYLTIFQNSETDRITIKGYNHDLNTSSDLGGYAIMFPKNVTTGTYNLRSTGFGAQITTTQNIVSYRLTEGSITILSHIGNNISGTFSFTASGQTGEATISNGSFNITHY